MKLCELNKFCVLTSKESRTGIRPTMAVAAVRSKMKIVLLS